MRDALFVTAALTALLALRRASARVGSPGVVAGVWAVALFGAGAYLDAPSPFRGACWLFGTAALGKTLALGRPIPGGLGRGRAFAYVFLWPGLDAARAFVPDASGSRRAGLRSLVGGGFEVAIGFAFATYAWRRGWLDGGTFVPAWCRLVSFGTFLDGGFRTMEGLLALLGFRPERNFRSPWRSRDPADFWANRWNRFVGRSLAVEVYRPMKRRVGRGLAIVLTFLASGVLHEALFRGATEGPFGRYLVFFVLHAVAVMAVGSWPARPGAASATRRAVSWVILLASAPLFFGGCYPAVAPFERILSAIL